MLKNYIKIAWRNLKKNKITSFINIGGLALGICCFFLLGTYVINELRYDSFHKNADRIVYLSYAYKAPTDIDFYETSVTPTAAVPVFKELFPEIEDGVRLYKRGGEGQSISVKYNGENFNESQFVYSDDSFFKIFSFDFIEGNPSEALKKPFSLVITESAATRYFGEEEALGKILIINNEPWQITGIIKDIPPYSQIQFNLLGSYNTLPRSKEESWGAANDISYLLLKSPDQYEELQSKIDHFINEYFSEDIAAGYDVKFPIQKLTDVRSSSKVMGGIGSTYIYLLAFIAISLLLIACINFANLVMARSAERVHEIGVKKVMGALRRDLISQFIFESFFTAAISLPIGIISAIVLMPFFNNYTGIYLSLESWAGGWFVLIIFILFILISLISGGGPAFVLSAIKSTESLKGKINNSMKGVFVRKSLIIFQFCISLLFIIATIIVGRQINYLHTKNTGIKRSQTIVLDASSMSTSTLLSFKNELITQPNIVGVTASYDSPVNIQGGYSLSVDEKPGDFTLSVTAIPVEKDFTSVFDMDIIAGSGFTEGDIVNRAKPNEENPEYSFILNVTALKSLGWSPQESIGKWVNLNGRRGRIKAIVNDFNFASLHNQIGPIVLFPEYNWFGKILVKTNSTQNMQQTISNIRKLWGTFNTDKLFDYHFLDDEYNALYISEERVSKILTLFSMATILVSALGLFALSSLVIQQRIKEIGVRKVLGASILSITKLVTKDFIKLVLIAIFIATPIAWWAMNIWLQDFAYHIEIKWWVFVLAGLLAIVIALVTVSFQAIKAAIANPVDSLRDE